MWAIVLEQSEWLFTALFLNISEIRFSSIHVFILLGIKKIIFHGAPLSFH